MAGKNSEARTMFNKALDASPKFARARMGLAFVDAIEGRKEEAKKEADAAVAVADEAYFHAHQAWVYAYAGSTAKAREILENLVGDKYEGYASPAQIGAVYYAVGEQDEGYKWMKWAHAERDPTLPWFNKWPILEIQKEDPRFVELLRQMGLP